MKQFLIIGLGNFGFYLATDLYRKGHDVMAIDKNPDLVQSIKDHVTQAVVADATDADTFKALGVTNVDTAVVGIGSVLGDSILTVLNLQEIGIAHIVAKAISDPHKKVLEKIGVKNILFPEKDTALSMARKLDNPSLIDYLPLMEGYGIIELAVPEKFVGKTLKQIDLTNKYGVQVVAIKGMGVGHTPFSPKADDILNREDLLILLGPEKGLDTLKTATQK
ncbi:potassium channel family protein [Desulfobacter latus]|uniref:TrkA family potassium uptake protein n=1 Tax=Desulfobacter latus TaxID=2292 RepID=A0A850T3H5_9BACT|nr:TrkA family potassium uptake protein [Desulfobacter latus]NWH03762.1 TrkA family potassium uptake protein [Desulfobacter latus]